MPQPVCKPIRDELVACLLRTDCVLRSGKTPQECLQSSHELPAQCQHLITAFSDCKKGMLDMRRRFRGNHLPKRTGPGGQDASLAVGGNVSGSGAGASASSTDQGVVNISPDDR